MKNSHVEHLRRSAKQSHRTARSHFNRGGIRIYHSYDDASDRLTWWDDVDFVLNDYRVAVSFIHPRMVYQDKIEKLAMARFAHLYTDDHLKSAIPNYQKVGRSRKKVRSWKCINLIDRTWLDAVSQEEARLAKTADFKITPFIKPEWTQYTRLVELCVPIEVRNEADLLHLATLCKRLLKRETALEYEFPGYMYTRDDWMRDGLAKKMTADLHTHSVK